MSYTNYKKQELIDTLINKDKVRAELEYRLKESTALNSQFRNRITELTEDLKFFKILSVGLLTVGTLVLLMAVL